MNMHKKGNSGSVKGQENKLPITFRDHNLNVRKLPPSTITNPTQPGGRREPQPDGESTCSVERYQQAPPISVIVVKGTPQSVSTSVDQPGPSPRTSSRPFHGVSTLGRPPIGFTTPAMMPPPPPPTRKDEDTGGDSSSSYFRLMPRGRSVSSTFDPKSRRGRKRGAQFLSLSPGSCSEDGQDDHLSAGTTSHDDDLVFSPVSTNRKLFEDSIDADTQENRTVELPMYSLSIKSPRVHRSSIGCPPASSSSPLLRARIPAVKSAMGSSFISYGSPSGEYSSYLRLRGDSIGSTSSLRLTKKHSTLSPAASTRSSPRFAPLTVLKNAGTGSETHNNGGPQQRWKSSSQMLSLDESTHKIRGSEEDDDPLIVFGSKIIPASVACSPAVSTTSSITKDYTPARAKLHMIPSTPQRTPMGGASTAGRAHMPTSPATPGGQSFQSCAHDTPIPSVKLTPRMTPRSRVSNHDASVPTPLFFARDLGLLPVGVIVDHSTNDGAMETDSETCSQNTATRFQQGTSCSLLTPPPPTPRSRASYLPFTDWSSELPTGYRPKQSFRSPSRDGAKCSGAVKIPTVKMTSLLAPPSSGGFLEKMIHEQERAAALDADGSLSDPDEEEPFVLTDPALLAEERGSTARARRRQRLSNTSLDQTAARPSSMLLSTPHASNTSLLGMDFLHGDSALSSVTQNFAFNVSRNSPVNTASKTRKESTSPSYSFTWDNRRPSENSLSSVGLAWESLAAGGNEDDCRDLVTPPTIEDDTYSPPPTSGGCHGRDSNTSVEARSVFFSRSSAFAVNETISMMAHQAGHHAQLSPQMKCRS